MLFVENISQCVKFDSVRFFLKSSTIDFSKKKNFIGFSFHPQSIMCDYYPCGKIIYEDFSGVRDQGTIF